VAEQVWRVQEKVYEAVDRQITDRGIEHNEQGWRADAYLYCHKVLCPECGWNAPLAPSWINDEKTRCMARFHADEAQKRFDIHIETGVSAQQLEDARKAATVRTPLSCARVATRRPPWQ
jgi:putative DNA methylase